MQIKKVVAWSIWLSIFSLTIASQSLTQNFEDKCFCKFDTDNYKAKCDCAILCAVAVKEGRDCNIVCDGTVSSAINGSDYFGGRRKYLDDVSNIIQFATRNGFKSFQDSYFSELALPKLIRSAYVNADFIEIDKKGELDNLPEIENIGLRQHRMS